MNYAILRCEDGALGGPQTAALLDGAKMEYLQHLAQAGSAGVIRPRSAAGLDPWQLHRALLGLGVEGQEASPARWYAAGASLELAPEETAWCCDLVTQRDGSIVDPTAGRIATKESEVLIHALDQQLGSETRRWEVGQDAQHLFIARDPALGAEGRVAVRAPERLLGQKWRRWLPKGPVGAALLSVLREASAVLEAHPINRVRVDLGENPANMLWLWGGTRGQGEPPARERAPLNRGVVSNSFALKGLARCLGCSWHQGLTSFAEASVQRLTQTVIALTDQQDFLYVHLRIESADPVERLCAMERIDQLLLKPLVEHLPRLGPWRLLAALDDRTTGTVPWVAIGTGLPQQPVVSFSGRTAADSPVSFPDGDGMFAWLTQGSG